MSRKSTPEITNPAIARLLRKAGVSRASGDVYNEVRSVLVKDLDKLMRTARTYAEHARRKTILDSDALNAIQIVFDKKVYGTTSTVTKACPPMPKSKRKSGSGEKALREVEYYQRQEGCVLIPAAPFVRLCKRLDDTWGGRYSATAMTTIQLFIEGHVVGLLCGARKVSDANGRKTLTSKDIKTSLSIKKGGC